MKPILKNISFTRGNTYGLKLVLNTSIVEIKNIYFTVKDRNETKLIEKCLDNGITLEENIMILKLKPSDTEELKENDEYKYDIQINYGLDDELTIMKGLFTVGWKVTD